MSITVNNQEVSVLISGQTASITVEPQSLELITVGTQGPQGSATNSTLNKIAGENLGGHRIVVLDSNGDAVYADNTDLTHVDKVLGMTTGSASSGGSVTIWRFGEFTEGTWNWTLNQPVFLGQQGQLTQTPPTSGFIQQVGFPISATSMFVSIHQAIVL